MTEARYFVPADSNRLALEYDRSAARELAYYGKKSHRALPTAYFLSLSGGADDGAFGAGSSTAGRRREQGRNSSW
jgi:hypothetical protein